MPLPSVPGENPRLDAETRVPLLIGMSSGFLAVSTIAVLLRLYTRYVVVKASGSDDITIAIAQVLAIGLSVTTILQAKHGLGLHSWLVGEDDGMSQLKFFFAAIVIYNLGQIVTKTSFLLQYRRIFQDKFTRTTCLVFLVFLGIWGVVLEVLLGLACTPVAVFFPSREAICINTLTVWYLTSVMNIVTDFLVFLIPMPAIRALQLRRKQKILVTSVFCLGFFTCVISIVRVFTLRSAYDSDDQNWDTAPSAYWSVVELNTGILCACLPPLRPLIRHMFPGLATPTHTLTYEERSSGKGPGGGKSRRSAAIAIVTGGAGPGVYPLRDVESRASGSQEGLKDESESWYHHRVPEYAAHGAERGYQLRTDIKGGAGVAGESGLPTEAHDGHGHHDNDDEDVVDWNARPLKPRIMVTREIGFKEGSSSPGAEGYGRERGF